MDPELRPAWSAQCMPGHLGLCSETLSWVNNNFLSRSCRRTIDRCRKNYLVPCLHSTDQVSQGIQGTKEFRSCSWDKTRPCNLALHCYFKFKQTPSMDRNDYNSIHPKEIRHILNITMMHVYTRTHICMCVCMCVYICACVTTCICIYVSMCAHLGPILFYYIEAQWPRNWISHNLASKT